MEPKIWKDQYGVIHEVYPDVVDLDCGHYTGRTRTEYVGPGSYGRKYCAAEIIYCDKCWARAVREYRHYD